GAHLALEHRVGDHRAVEVDGADRVAVAGDGQVHHSGIAVRVYDADAGDAQALGLPHGDVFAARVGDEDDAREARHPLQALEVVQFLDAAAHRLEVGERAAEPAVVDVVLAAAVGVLGDRLLRLLLRAHEEDTAAVGDGFADQAVGLVDLPERDLEVDDVDAV